MNLAVILTLAAVSLTAGILTYALTVRREYSAPSSEVEALHAACMRAATRHHTRTNE